MFTVRTRLLFCCVIMNLSFQCFAIGSVNYGVSGAPFPCVRCSIRQRTKRLKPFCCNFNRIISIHSTNETNTIPSTWSKKQGGGGEMRNFDIYPICCMIFRSSVCPNLEIPLLCVWRWLRRECAMNFNVINQTAPITADPRQERA